MEEGLRAISTNKECPTDELLANQVRLQIIAQKAANVRTHQVIDEMNGLPVKAVETTASLPMFLYLKALQTKLQSLRESLPTHLQQQGAL